MLMFKHKSKQTNKYSWNLYLIIASKILPKEKPAGIVFTVALLTVLGLGFFFFFMLETDSKLYETVYYILVFSGSCFCVCLNFWALQIFPINLTFITGIYFIGTEYKQSET